ncbi:MAG: hypothetical protein D6785_08680, partial [Planctomycetota bacterium]
MDNIQHLFNQFQENPEDLQSLRKLTHRLLQEGRTEEVCKVYNLHKATIASSEEKKNRLLEWSDELKRIGAFEAALGYYKEAASLDPKDLKAIRGIRAMAQALKKWEDLLMALDLEIKLVRDPKEKAKIFFEMGEIHFRKLQDLKEGENFYNRALLLDGEYLDAILGLEEIYRTQENWDMLAGILASKEPLIQDEHEKALLAKEVGMIWEEKLDEPKQAASWYLKALYEDLHDFSLMDRLEKLTYEKDWDLYIRVRLLRSAQVAEAKEKASILDEVSQIWIRVGKESRAISCLERAFHADPSQERLIKLIQLYRKMNFPYNHAQSLIKYADLFLSKPQEKIDYLLQAAKILEEKFPHEALQVYLKAKDIQPSSKIFEALKNLTGKHQMWQTLLEILEEHIEWEKDKSIQASLWMDHGIILREKLDDFDLAIKSFQKALSCQEDLTEAFEQIEEILEIQENWQGLVDLYRQWLEKLQKEDSPYPLYYKIAYVYLEKLNKWEESLPFLEKGWKLAPASPEFFDLYSRALEKGKKWEKLVQIYFDHAQKSLENESLLEICLEGAEIAKDKLNSPEKALQFLELAYQKFPHHPTLLEELLTLHLILKNWQKAIQIGMEKLKHVEDPEEKAFLYYQIGGIYHRHLNNTKEGKAYYQLALNHRPDYLDVLDSLEEVYQIEQNYGELVKTLQRKAQILEEPKAKEETLLKAAQIIEEKLDAGPLAEEAYREIFQQYPHSKEAFLGLERALQHQKKHEDLAKLYAQWAKKEKSLVDKAKYYYQAGLLCWNHLESPKKAISLFQKARNFDPGNPEILKTLVQAYKEEKMVEEEASLLENYIPLLEGPEEANSRLRLAYLFENRLKLPYRAFQEYKAVWNLFPGEMKVLDRLLVLSSKLELWEEYFHYLQEKINLLETSFGPEEKKEEKGELHKQAGLVALEKLERKDQAIQHFE